MLSGKIITAILVTKNELLKVKWVYIPSMMSQRMELVFKLV
jgi:hypothetical protein